MRRGTLLLRAHGLPVLLDAICACRVQFDPEDIYRICALLKAKEDPLALQTNQSFLRSLRTQYAKMDSDSVTPFQRTFIDGALGALPSDAPNDTQLTAVAPPSPPGVDGGDPTVEARLAAIWDLVQESHTANFVGSDVARKMQEHCKALQLQLRQMRPFEVASLVKALAMMNYQDYTFTNLLTRRSCEVVAKLTSTELCRTYFNLSKLQSHDSMVAFVNQIEARMDNLTREQLSFVAAALERHPQISSAPGRMVPKLLARAVVHLPETDGVGYHRALLAVMARYNLQRHTAVATVLKDTARHVDSIGERDLLAILQAAANLGVPANTPGFAALIGRAESVASTVDIRSVDAMMDILSVLPLDTSGVMEKLMARLTVDAGRLSVSQVVSILDLLSSYPPARGNASIASLAIAAALRADSYDGDALEQLVLSLAQLGHFVDEFYTLVGVLQKVKGGFRSFERLAELMRCCTAEVVTDVRGQDMITKGILSLAPVMNDEELAEARKLLMQLGVKDQEVHQMIFRRAKQLQRDSGGRWARRRRDNDDDFV